MVDIYFVNEAQKIHRDSMECAVDHLMTQFDYGYTSNNTIVMTQSGRQLNNDAPIEEQVDAEGVLYVFRTDSINLEIPQLQIDPSGYNTYGLSEFWDFSIDF